MKRLFHSFILLLSGNLLYSQSVCPTNYNASATNETIYNSCNGSITITTTGGNPPLIFEYTEIGNPTNTGSILYNGTSYTFLNLCPGDYLITIYDNLGNACPFGGPPGNNTVTIFPAASSLSVTCDVNAGAPMCTGMMGMVSANAIGNAPPFQYNFFLSTGPTGYMPSNMAFDPNPCMTVLSVTVMDASGNTATSNCWAMCSTPPPVNVTTTPACFGSCNGSANISILSGMFNPSAAPYAIEITDGFTVTPVGTITTASQILTINNLCADNYFVVVYSNNPSCASIPGSNPFNIIQNPQVIVNSINQIDNTCYGSCDGSIVLNVSGGTSPYTIQNFDCSSGTPVGTTNLCAGNYCPAVTDAIGCMPNPISPIQINEPPLLEIFIDSIYNESIAGASDGEIFFHLTGGSPAYSFTLDGNPVFPPFDNLSAGNYTVCVIDDNSCMACSTLTVGNDYFCNLSINATLTQPTCSGICDGIIDIITSGNNGSVTYLWSDGETTSTASNLCTGMNCVSLTDSLGCQIDTCFVLITLPLTANYSSTIINCFGECTGSITINAQGGPTGNYSYSLDGINWTTQNIFDSLCAGTFPVFIADSVFCTATIMVTLTENSELQLVIDSVIQASSGTAADGEIQISVSGGVVPYTISITGGSLINLLPGDYEICITDSLACETCDSVNVGFPTSINPIAENNFRIYPNPAEEFVIVEFMESFTGSILVMDITGKIICEKIVSGKLNSLAIEEFESGVYLLMIITESGNYIEKIVFE